VIDPITAYLDTSENSGISVRRLLKPLAALARERQLAIIAVSHLRKKDGTVLYRTNGSLAFVNAARSAWLATRHPEDRSRRLMLPIKNNLANDATGLEFAIQDRDAVNCDIAAANGESLTGSRPTIRWSLEPATISADQAIARPNGRPPTDRDDAARWLRQALASGARPFDLIRNEAVANGYQLITLRRAFRQLGGEAVRLGFGPLGEWFWRLPGIGDQNPEPTLDHLWPDLGIFAPKPGAGV
jgi:hypothetical protein